MRLANFLSPASNRAALSITQTLYDRRALDCTSSRPLVQSLQQLMILTGSSSRVRETLCSDGGLERIVQMMKEAHEHWQDPLMAYKWHLCMQCLLNLGARGSEHVRMRILEAGAIPVIVTILDNYLLAHSESLENRDRCHSCGCSGSNMSASNASVSNSGNATVHQTTMPTANPAGLGLTRTRRNDSESGRSEQSFDSIPRQDLRLNIDMQAVSRIDTAQEGSGSDSEIASGRGTPGPDSDAVRLPTLATESESNPQLDSLANMESFIAQRANTEVLPPTVQLTQLNTRPSAELDQSGMAQFVDGVLIPKEQDVFWALEIIAFVSKYSHLRREMQDTHFLPKLSLRSPDDAFANGRGEDFMDAESEIPNDTMTVETSVKEFPEQNAAEYYHYDFENDGDFDDEFLARSVNLFEIVEKFTAFRSLREFPHWACIIMRNFVRKDEGGIRQCANFACGKWEEYPRQFAKCRRCKRTKYCSKACQLKAWGMHRYWCSPSSSTSQQSSQVSSQPNSQPNSQQSSQHGSQHSSQTGRPSQPDGQPSQQAQVSAQPSAAMLAASDSSVTEQRAMSADGTS